SSGNVVVTRKPGTDYFVGGAWRMGEGFYSSEGWPDYMWIPYSILKPSDYANKDVDIDWIRDHILPPGGADDPTATSGPPPPSPRPSPHPSSSSSPRPLSDLIERN